jgi:hypothetical protein
VAVVAACTSFSGQSDPAPASGDAAATSDAAASPDAAAPDAAAPDAATDEGGVTSHIIRCGGSSCNTPEKCCLPFYAGDAGCVPSPNVCGTDIGELLCSDRDACQAGEVCCLKADLNSGQTGYVIASTFCVAESACADGPLVHAACRLGAQNHCGINKSCMPYVKDTNGSQPLPVDTAGYATCQ